MKSITVHKLEPELADRIEQKAREEGQSMNATIKTLLRESLGLTKSSAVNHRKDFEDLFGSWSEEEAKEFDARTRDLRQVDEADWKD